MKLLNEYAKQIAKLGELKRVWFTSFNFAVEFFESHILPATLNMDTPKGRLDYESLQIELNDKGIDLRVFCDQRMLRGLENKRTAIDVHPIHPRSLKKFSKKSLFHPKVIYLEDKKGRAILGSGSANITMSGWARNQEVFAFRKVATAEQSAQIHYFFKEIIDIKPLYLGRKYWGTDTTWEFIHSFQRKSFLESLLNEKDEELAIWSPYFPPDNLAEFTESIKDQSGLDKLRFLITPDRVDNKYIRTQWSQALQKKMDNGEVRFFDSSLQKHINSELCHAKVWKTKTSLAIGSWNFTAPGSNSLVNAKQKRTTENNIEAGFIFRDDSTIQEALGKNFSPSKDDFASAELLSDEALELENDEDLPFDIRVYFDWEKQVYHIEGNWLQNGFDTNYKINLPDVGSVNILGKRKNADLDMNEIHVKGISTLITQHNYTIFNKKKEVSRGFIIELNAQHRRVQGYESLNDLIDSLVMNMDPMTSNNTILRDELHQDDELFANEHTDVVTENTHASTSYFRLFQATDVFEQRIQSIKTLDQLEKHVFVYPGCLLELADKIKNRQQEDTSTIFNWFLAQELKALVKVATKKYAEVREKYTSNTPPAHKWDQLKISTPKLPRGLEKEYIKLIRKECGYVR